MNNWIVPMLVTDVVSFFALMITWEYGNGQKKIVPTKKSVLSLFIPGINLLVQAYTIYSIVKKKQVLSKKLKKAQRKLRKENSELSTIEAIELFGRSMNFNRMIEEDEFLWDFHNNHKNQEVLLFLKPEANIYQAVKQLPIFSLELCELVYNDKIGVEAFSYKTKYIWGSSTSDMRETFFRVRKAVKYLKENKEQPAIQYVLNAWQPTMNVYVESLRDSLEKTGTVDEEIINKTLKMLNNFLKVTAEIAEKSEEEKAKYEKEQREKEKTRILKKLSEEDNFIEDALKN